MQAVDLQLSMALWGHSPVSSCAETFNVQPLPSKLSPIPTTIKLLRTPYNA